MTDRTERNKVFSAKKVMIVVTLGLIFNYVFIIKVFRIKFFSTLQKKLNYVRTYVVCNFYVYFFRITYAS